MALLLAPHKHPTSNRNLTRTREPSGPGPSLRVGAMTPPFVGRLVTPDARIAGKQPADQIGHFRHPKGFLHIAEPETLDLILRSEITRHHDYWHTRIGGHVGRGDAGATEEPVINNREVGSDPA